MLTCRGMEARGRPAAGRLRHQRAPCGRLRAGRHPGSPLTGRAGSLSARLVAPDRMARGTRLDTTAGTRPGPCRGTGGHDGDRRAPDERAGTPGTAMALAGRPEPLLLGDPATV